jgi:basic amino acid/polyamine antiporter, APA family
MIAAILFLDVERLASLGSAFLLLLFALINLSVILMRESRMTSYAPGYLSPLYPWMQIAGFVATVGLIFTLGVFYVVFILAIGAISYLWYRLYVRARVPRRGAIFGLFRRLGELHDEGVDAELWSILQERGASEGDSFDELVARACVIDLDERLGIEEVTVQVVDALTDRLPVDRETVATQLDLAAARGIVPERAPAAVYDLMIADIEHAEVVLVRSLRGVRIAGAGRFPGGGSDDTAAEDSGTVQALVFLATPEQQVTRHLRLLAQLVSMVEIPGFVRAWRRARTDQELRETLLRDERFASFVVGDPGPPSLMVDRRLREIDFPGDTLVAMVRRGDRTIVPDGATLLREGDRLTVLGSPEDVALLRSGV